MSHGEDYWAYLALTRKELQVGCECFYLCCRSLEGVAGRMRPDGKTLQQMIARRAERRTEAKREAQGMLFPSREAECEWLTALAERSIRNSGFTIAELDAERERSRRRKANAPAPSRHSSIPSPRYMRSP